MDEVNGLIEAVISWVSASLKDRASPGRVGAEVFVDTTSQQRILPTVGEEPVTGPVWERVKL